MFCLSDLARCRIFASMRMRRLLPPRQGVVLTVAWMAFGCVLEGCQSPNYTARNLPLELQAPAAPASTGINLERLGSSGIGTSQIGPGDLVEITVVSGNSDERVVPVPSRVARDGTVVVPLIGPVSVGGLEPVAAEQRIAAAALERGIYRQPHVTLTVAEQAVNRVTVLGAVAKPGVVELPRGSCDLASALAAAGGLSKEAGTRVEILHRGNRSFLAGQSPKKGDISDDGVRLASYTDPVNPTAAPLELASPTADPEEIASRTIAQPGAAEMTRIDLAQSGPATPENRKLDDSDVVMVLPDDKRVIHVTGLVSKPDQFELTRDKDIRLLDAIAMAGGTTSPVADKVYVIRRLPNMAEPEVIKVSMSAAKQNGDENLRLAAGDLVSVESTLTTMTLDTVGKFFRLAVGLNGRVAGF